MSLAASVAVGVMLARISAQSTAAQVSRAEAVVARSCDVIRERYAFYATGWRGPVPALDDDGLARDLATVTTVALARQGGVVGGIWQADAGALAYADPNGAETAPDLPAAELPRLRAANEQAARDEQAVAVRWSSGPQTVLLQACPLGGPIASLTAWALTRVQASEAAKPLGGGLGLLFALMLGMSGWLAWMLVSWSRQVAGVAGALAGHAADSPPVLARTGEPGLDRIVDALNAVVHRLGAARRQSEALTAQVLDGKRMAALGRVAAGVAHEIRNPIATMRLRAENALVSQDEARRGRALQSVLEQVARLDRLSGELLAMTQRHEPALEPADLRRLLQGCADDHAEQAETTGVAMAVAGGGTARLDPALIRRALDNLVGNALRHTPGGGQVTMTAGQDGGDAWLAVADTGPGIPTDLLGSLFEPFVTGRPDGTGLGLAIAREMVEAHGGHLGLDPAWAGGTRFVITLPAAGRDM